MNDSEPADERPLPQHHPARASAGAHAPNPNPGRSTRRASPGSTLTPSVLNPECSLTKSSTQQSTLVQDVAKSRDEKGGSKEGVAVANEKSRPQAAPAVVEKGDGTESAAIEEQPKLPIGKRFLDETKRIFCASWLNWLLVFVPIGFAFGIMSKILGDASPISPNVVFAMNAIAIIPLAYLLCYATESLATKVGDTLGALLNVSFGNGMFPLSPFNSFFPFHSLPRSGLFQNIRSQQCTDVASRPAVELIIFIIALVAKEIRIVQAALLGSILVNLLLILGMCFLFGGLRYREQVRKFCLNSHIRY
jgi:Ca2+:H+ antiporter